MQSSEIRERFLKFFERHDHRRVKSSSLIPAADPTLLFTNAGMVQFKDAFLGQANLGYRRATTSQKCVRAGGKHNDLENVGFTPRHHTFFEMLGNFSFGDYFKKDAIAFAWEFLTKDLGLPKERLRITVFREDDEAMELWKAQGIRPDWIERLDEKDNFWAMGDTGPCGPCTEIHYDWGPEYGDGDSPGTDKTGLRFLEIWNLVFMQFNRDASGKLTPLPKPSVDTGSGLERLAAVMQGVYTNYDTDVFQTLIKAIGNRVGIAYGKSPETDVAMRVIADHLRAVTFLIADGVVPSNEGRGYVLRRILRRAIRYGKKLGQEKPFIHELIPSVGKKLGQVYPEIVSGEKLISTLVREEEEKFHETLHRGTHILEEALTGMKKNGAKVLSGEVTFRLYDSFGFPLDLIEVICREENISVDIAGFEALMEKQREQSGQGRTTDKTALESVGKGLEGLTGEVRFTGYESLSGEGKCLLLFDEKGQVVKSLPAGQSGMAVFDVTPFYAESGGQVGDEGTITSGETRAAVQLTSKILKRPVHHLKVQAGSLKSGESYQLQVNPETRKRTMINHTATHMLHAALRKVLGDRVKQAGSLVDANRLRFDFTFPKAVSTEELRQIEAMVNAEVAKGSVVTVKEMSYDEAIKSGALAFFDEKYGDRVRVVRVGDGKDSFSVELCGGTHLSQISDIGYLKITSESSVASGVRRLEAITATAAMGYFKEREGFFTEVESLVGAKAEQAVKKVTDLQAQLRQLQKENEQLRIKAAQGASRGASTEASGETIGNLKLFFQTIEGADAKVLRALVDQVRDRAKEKAVVAVVGTEAGKVSFCIGLTKDLVGQRDAGKLVKELAPLVGGSGGGRADFAQAGGTNPAGIAAVQAKLKELLG